VGSRRSALWLMAHFYNPAEVSRRSIMPSFAFLFRDERGDDLLAYLESLKGGDTAAHLKAEQAWHLPAAAQAGADSQQGAALFQSYCGTCHNGDGRTRSAWKASFKRLPTNFAAGRLFDLPGSDSREQRLNRIAQITKFGIPGTDMPGHEYLPDEEIASISLWLSQNIAQPVANR
jgi:cytochrome c oxidase cbb3-type subunit 2